MSMFLVTTEFQESRSRRNPGKPGKIYLRITSRSARPDGSTARTERNICTGICATDASAVKDHRAELVVYVRMLYCLFERYHDSGQDFAIDDVTADFRRTLKGDEAMADIRKRAASDFPLRSGIISVGNCFKGDFNFVYPDDAATDSLTEYIVNKARRLRHSGKASSAKSYLSTRRSLVKFSGGRNVRFADIDRDFISGYSDWLKAGGVSDSTQSFYLRTLRSILNHAREEGLHSLGDDMFAGLNTRVTFRAESDAADAPDRDTLRKIADADFSADKELELARDMFMFGFYCRGMDLGEIIGLTKTCVKDGVLTYLRRMKGLERSVRLDEAAMGIVRKYRNCSDTYIFPLKEVLRGRQTRTITDRIARQLKMVGHAVNFPRLSFGMNISAWQNLMAQADLSDILLRKA